MADESKVLLGEIVDYGENVMMPTLLRIEKKLDELAAEMRAMRADLITARLAGYISENASKSASPFSPGLPDRGTYIPKDRK